MLLCIGRSVVLRTLSLSRLLNRQICDSFTLAQISSHGETSQIPVTLSTITGRKVS